MHVVLVRQSRALWLHAYEEVYLAFAASASLRAFSAARSARRSAALAFFSSINYLYLALLAKTDFVFLVPIVLVDVCVDFELFSDDGLTTSTASCCFPSR